MEPPYIAVDGSESSPGPRPSELVPVLLQEHHVELVVLGLGEEGPNRAVVVVVRLQVTAGRDDGWGFPAMAGTPTDPLHGLFVGENPMKLR